jgi:hypothetical protein
MTYKSIAQKRRKETVLRYRQKKDESDKVNDLV